VTHRRETTQSRDAIDESLASTVESGNHKEKQKDELPPVTVTFTRFVRRGSARARGKLFTATASKS